MNAQEINMLGQVTDVTWGRASTGHPIADVSITTKLHGNHGMRVLYKAVVQLGSISESEKAMTFHKKKAYAALEAFIKKVKSEFKKLSEKPLKVKRVSDTHSLELITFSYYNPARKGYYRLSADFDVNT